MSENMSGETIDPQLQTRLQQALPQTELAVPAINDFLAQLITAFGGPTALAQEYVQTYREAKRGSTARVQLMGKMTDLLMGNTRHFGPPPKVEEMSDEEMVAVLEKFMGAYNSGLPTTTDEGGSSGEAQEEAGHSPEDPD